MSGNQDEMVIVVMGGTGTGKSSFVRLLSGDTGVHIGNSLEPETNDIQIVPFYDSESGRDVIMVDPPGFDDSRDGVSDTDILKAIADFLLDEYDKDRKLNGLIYLQRISDSRFGNQSSRDLEIFSNLCGAKAYENVVVLTTFWDQISSEEGDKREEQLKTKSFKDLLEGGAHFMRHNQTLEGARDVLRHISALAPTNVQLQEEIRLEGKAFEDTAAGFVYQEEVNQIVAKHNEEMGELKDELDALDKGNDALRLGFEEERAKLQREKEDERAKLRESLDEAKEAQKRLEVDVVKAKADREKWRRDQEREWQSRFDARGEEHAKSMQVLQAQIDQEITERDIIKIMAKPKGTIKRELAATKKDNSSLRRELEEERARFQRESARWEEERAELKKILDEARQLLLRLDEDALKENVYRKEIHRMEVKWIIVKHKEEVAELEHELGMMKRSNDILKQEYEEEWVRSQLEVARWKAERAELKREMDDAWEAQRSAKAAAAM